MTNGVNLVKAISKELEKNNISHTITVDPTLPIMTHISINLLHNLDSLRKLGEKIHEPRPGTQISHNIEVLIKKEVKVPKGHKIFFHGTSLYDKGYEGMPVEPSIWIGVQHAKPHPYTLKR